MQQDSSDDIYIDADYYEEDDALPLEKPMSEKKETTPQKQLTATLHLNAAQGLSNQLLESWFQKGKEEKAEEEAEEESSDEN